MDRKINLILKSEAHKKVAYVGLFVATIFEPALIFLKELSLLIP